MLIATESFVDPSDGGTIHAGRTRVSEDSDVAMAFPSRFRPVSDSVGRSGGMTALVDAPSRRAIPPVAKPRPDPPQSWRETPLLHADATPKITVVMTRGALRIREELDRARFSLQRGFETGGFVMSRDRFGSRVEIISASGLEDGRRRLGAVHLDSEWATEANRVYEDTFNLSVVGSWHTHPGRDSRPSIADMRSAALRTRLQGTSRAIDLILVDKTGEWRRPEIHAWTTSTDHGFPVTRPTRVEGKF